MQQGVHLGGIFATFGLVCEACYVYHPHNELWLVPMRCILDLMFRTAAMPCLYHSVAVLDRYFDLGFRAAHPDFDCPFGRGQFHPHFRGQLWVPSHSLEGPDNPYRLLACTYRLVDVIWPAPTVLWM